MASYNSNKVDYMAEVVTVPTAARTGRRLDALFGYVADGFYDWDDFDVGGELGRASQAYVRCRAARRHQV